MWVVLFIRVPCSVPNLVRHPYKKDPERDIKLENYPCVGPVHFCKVFRAKHAPTLWSRPFCDATLRSKHNGRWDLLSFFGIGFLGF